MDERKNHPFSEGSRLTGQIVEGLIHTYGYSADEIGIQVPLQRGLETRRADLVVYESAKKATPLIVFEVKKTIGYHAIADLQNQLISYLKGSGAKYAVLTDGKNKICYTVAGSRILEIPDIPRKNEALKKLSREQLKPAANLEHKLWKILDITKASLPSAEYFNEINKLILCKLLDEQLKGPLRFTISSKELDNMQNPKTQRVVLDRINSLFEVVKEWYPDVFDKTESVSLDATTIATVLSELQSYSFSKMSEDILGNFYEYFIRLNMKTTLGQYSTPPQIVDLIVGLLGPTQNDTVLDPACGSGGFVLKTMIHVWNKNGKTSQTQEYPSKKLFAIDINKNMVAVAKMNFLLHGDGHSNVFLGDSLKSLPSKVEKIASQGGFDIIMCDPPIGGKRLRDQGYENYLSFKKKTLARLESLFLERCMQLLKPGGRMAVIVSEGILFSESNLKSILLQSGYLKAVIGLPPAAFFSHGLNIKTSIIILEKTDPHSEPKDRVVFMAEIRDVGAEDYGNSLSNDLCRVLDAYWKFAHQGVLEGSLVPRIFSIRLKELGSDWTVRRNDPVFSRELNERLEENLSCTGGSICHLEDIASMSRGLYVSSQNYVSGKATKSIPYIRIGDMQEEKIDKSNLKYVIVRDTIPNESSLLKPGDILFSADGTIGKVAVVDKSTIGIASSGIIIIRPDQKTVDNQYLHMILGSDIIKDQVEQFKTGTVIPHIPLRDIRRLKIPVPSLAEQKKIAEKVLSLKERVANLSSEKKEIQKEISKILGGRD